MTDTIRYTDAPANLRADAYKIPRSRISWGAIFAGVAIALTLHLLLNLLGLSIGAGVIDPVQGDTPTAATLSMSSVIWFVVSGIIAAFAGGYVSSRMSGRHMRSTGSLHGLTSWAVTTIVVFYLLSTSIGAIVGGAFAGLGGIVSGAGAAVGTAATAAAPSIANATNPMAAIEQQIRQTSGGNDPQVLRDTAVSAMQAVLTGDQAQVEDARNRAAEALARAQNISVDQARQQVQTYETQYRQFIEEAKKRATDAAAATATAVSAGAAVAFAALLLGAIASLIGGAVGTPKRTIYADDVEVRS